MKDLDLRCRNCGRFLGLKNVHSIIAQVRCPSSKCKTLNNIKVVTPDSAIEDINYRFSLT